MNIRSMRKGDIPWVLELGLGVSELSTGTSSPQLYSAETLRKWITNPSDVLLVAEEGGHIIAYSLTSYNPFSRDAYMHVSVVHEAYRRKGIGSRMLDHTLEILEAKGCNNIFCLVKSDNIAIQKLLKGHGFEIGESFLYVQRSLPR